MLKTVFVAPDPGRLRLRASARAVLGIGAAVAVSGAAGYSLTAVIACGLTALLALFTVADPTVRGQALTTALLPVAGFPVLALAATLHDSPRIRDAAFLAVVSAGVYARRWGPRGHALGIFAFMAFFMTQFLHTGQDRLPELFGAVTLSLTVTSAVRFGLWCYERRLPPPAAPAPPAPGRGLARTTTRQALQATVACAVALAIGQALSPDRWYWAVGTAWWIFVNTASRGETLVRGFRRVVGTVVGIAAGLLVAVPLDGALAPTAALVAVCVFGIFYTAAVSYSWMMFFVTVMAGLLYGLLGVLHPGLLLLRFEETAAGALGVALAVTVVLPVTTHAATNAWIGRALTCVHICTTTAARRLAGDEAADPGPPAAELEALLAKVRLSLAPLVHPLSPLRARKARARRVLALLDDCAREARGFAALAAGPGARLDAELAAACRRVEDAVEHAVHALAPLGAAHSGRAAATAAEPSRPPGAEGALAHLHRLERALAELASPLRTAPRAPLAPV
ncbi:FUSC family protein [Streptomyces corynorhini]|uniref:FUSC family protein n=1 Tax=Streptomyces corynorhini TaxID=2282652 RepID=A0A370B051_9ACTN|nr:FUSC family protein [Streptomyces corynorhini]RDG34961.1 FUSC family protein [Streptomyces corynorhini]